MIIKSFFKKKTTKIYIVITILFALVLSLSLNFRNYYNNIINDYFEGSFYYINIKDYNEVFSSIDKKYELDNLKQIKAVDSKFSEVLFYIDNNLNDNEVGISKYFIDDGKDYSDISITKLNKEFIKNYNYDFDYQIHAINSNTLNSIGSKYNDAYVFRLKEWSLKDDFDKYCEEKLDRRFSLYSTPSSNKASKYVGIVNILSSIPLILSIIYFIVFIIMVINILNEDKNKNNIYSEIGYSKKVILKNNIIKIIIMLLVLMISLVLFYFIINLFL